MVITVLGSAGGVARAVLTLLNCAAKDPNDPIHQVVGQCQLHLIDRRLRGKTYYAKLLPALSGRYTSHQFSLRNVARFREHLKQSGTEIVIDVSWADTVDMLRCCNGLGVRYINTAMENTMVDTNEERFKGFPMLERMKHFDSSRADFTNTTAVICSGMNPGAVQWMVRELLSRNGGARPLGCYIVEQDDSFFVNRSLAKRDTIYTTWSPECFLDEAIANYPLFVSHSTPVILYDAVYALEFKVTLGARQFYGCLMPHEEVLTLGRLYPMECGFLYRVNDHTTDLIRENLDQPEELWERESQVLDPAVAPLDGEDLVGVLLVYEDKELYMYNVMRNQDVFGRYGVNATYFQVACGVYAALAALLLDPIPRGIYYVDELLDQTPTNYGAYLTQYMTDFVFGQNAQSDGLLLQRMRRADL